MASQGPRFPGTTASLANAGTSENAEAWVNPGNIVSDNGTEAAITAATYDSPDISQLLVASNFGFTIPAGATIDGITVEIDRRSIIANSGKDFRVQLAKGTTFASLVGTNKAVPATIWPTSSAVATYGGAADLWGTTWTDAEIDATSFAVFLSCQANIANADVGVDFIRVTVTYTEPPMAGSSAGSATAVGNLTTRTAAQVVGDSAVPTSGDTLVQGRLQAAGLVVYLVDDSAAADTSRDIVVICESCTAGTVLAKYKNVANGTLVLEPGVTGDMDLASTDATVGGSEDNISILDSAHPLSGGWTGTLGVRSPAARIDYNNSSELAAAADEVYSTEASATQIVGYAYEAGATMQNAHVAEGRRAYCGLGPDATLGNLGAYGQKILDYAIKWVAKIPNTALVGSSAGVATASSELRVSPWVEGFETGDLTRWNETNDGGASDSISVASGSAHDGSFGAHITEDAAGLATYARRYIGPTNKVRVAGWFRSPTEGGAGNNNANLRVFAGGVRIIDFYRQNVDGGLWMRTRTDAGTNVFTRLANDGYASTNEWYHIEALIEYLGSGAVSRIKVEVDYSISVVATGLDLDSGNYDMVQIGAEHPSQPVDLDVDGIEVEEEFTNIRLVGSSGGTSSASGTMPGAADTALAGSSAGAGTATGNLTTAIPLISTPSAGVGTAAGNLTTSIKLVSTPSAGVGTAAGSLTTQIKLAGASTAAASAVGSLTTSIRFAGSSAGVSTGVSALTTQIRLVGASAGTSTADGTLGATTGDTALAGSSAGASSASASLTTSIRFASTSAGSSTATGALTTQIRLGGAANGLGTAAGLLTTQIRLVSTPVAGTSTAASVLTTAIRFAGVGAGVATATGGLTTQIVLSGMAAGQSFAVATLVPTNPLVYPLSGQITFAGRPAAEVSKVPGITAEVTLDD